MPFGLCNAPATFQRTMYLLIKDYHDFSGMYIDDLLVLSETIDEHVNYLRLAFLKLREQKFYYVRDKCSFNQPEVAYCGIIVDCGGVRAQP